MDIRYPSDGHDILDRLRAYDADVDGRDCIDDAVDEILRLRLLVTDLRRKAGECS